MPKAKYSRTNVHLRKDVVNKSIIRAFSRFYNNNFTSKFDGDAEDLADFIAHSNDKNLITTSIDYQEHFSITNEEGSKSKLFIFFKIICFEFEVKIFHLIYTISCIHERVIIIYIA